MCVGCIFSSTTFISQGWAEVMYSYQAGKSRYVPHQTGDSSREVSVFRLKAI